MYVRIFGLEKSTLSKSTKKNKRNGSFIICNECYTTFLDAFPTFKEYKFSRFISFFFTLPFRIIIIIFLVVVVVKRDNNYSLEIK